MNQRLAQSLTPEWRFILACARLEPDPAVIEQAASAVTSWDTATADARRNHLAPLVSRSLERAANVPVPKSVRQALTEDRQRTLALNTIYLRSAHEVLGAFVDAGLTPVVLKGVALAENLYADIGLRPFCDLDALFGLDDIPRAEAVLAQLGYRAEISPHERAWYFENYYQLPRHSRPPNRFCVELHWDFGRRPNPFKLNVDDMRERAVAATVAGIGARRLDPQDELLHLCVHLAWGNGFDGHLRGVVDIAESLRRGIDWETFEGRVAQSNTAQVVVPAIELAQWLLDAPVDDVALGRLQRLRGGVLSRYVTAIGQARALSGGEGHRTLMRLFWIERLRERIHLLRQNFGSVEFAEFDSRPGLAKRILGGIRRAAAPFVRHA